VPWGGAGGPAAGQPGLGATAAGELLLAQPPAERRHYRLAAATGAGEPWITRPPLPTDLAYPPGRQPRLEALAQQWRPLPTAAARLAAARAWFMAQPFRYSRRPGLLPERAGLDVFLFERRQGFCGHYASAFTALMRAAGVPARLVSGYRGGSWVRPLGGSPFLDLRQSDAHAWSEVWLPERGWTRVDPSAWIAAAALEAEGPSPAWSWWQRQWWGLDAAWTRWWLGFDRSDQEALQRRLLGDRRDRLGWLLLALVMLLLPPAVGLVRLLAPGAGPPDRLRQRLERALGSLARQGLAPAPGEPLLVFSRRAALARPELARPLRALSVSYGQLRWARLSPARRRARRRRLRWAAGTLARQNGSRSRGRGDGL
ncbi:MAG: transglutaminase-like domain-containing protein, partial [Prochlorococcaceae cyanobacterium]